MIAARIYLATRDCPIIITRQIDHWQANRPLDVRASADSDNIHHFLAYDPGRTERIFCGIPEQGLWRSDDGGSAWDWTSPCRQPARRPRGISTAPVSEALSGAVIRLLECLKRPFDSRLLARQTVRKIIYRVSRGEQGGSLRALGRRGEHFSRIARVLKHPPCRVRRAAPYEGPGEAGGHERVGLPSPLQAGDSQLSGPVPQADSTRPSQAAHGHDGYNASTAPRAVGYESRSQYSREWHFWFSRARLLVCDSPLVMVILLKKRSMHPNDKVQTANAVHRTFIPSHVNSRWAAKLIGNL